MSSQDVREHRYGWSNDGDLADEIRIYGDLVVAASESDRILTLTEIDAALGLSDRERGDDPRGPRPPEG
jgi:hypothetical protein